MPSADRGRRRSTGAARSRPAPDMPCAPSRRWRRRARAGRTRRAGRACRSESGGLRQKAIARPTSVAASGGLRAAGGSGFAGGPGGGARRQSSARGTSPCRASACRPSRRRSGVEELLAGELPDPRPVGRRDSRADPPQEAGDVDDRRLHHPLARVEVGMAEDRLEHRLDPIPGAVERLEPGQGCASGGVGTKYDQSFLTKNGACSGWLSRAGTRPPSRSGR